MNIKNSKIVLKKRPIGFPKLDDFEIVNETINKPSPKPNSIKPKHKKKNVESFGLKLYVLSELHLTFGIFLIFKNILISYFYY